MEIDFLNLVFGGGQDVAEFFSSSFLVAALKFFFFVYVAVLFVDIVLLLILRGLGMDLKKVLYGTERPIISRTSSINRWEKILSRLESHNASQYKVAVLEADAWAEELLGGIGYKGATMSERLEQVRAGQLETKDILAEAHAVRNRIVHQKDFVLSREEAERSLMEYKKFFDELELF